MEKHARRGWSARACLVAFVAVAGVIAVPSPASATHGQFRAYVNVGGGGGAIGTVSDTFLHGSVYTVTLTAAGAGTCGLLSPTTQIVGFDFELLANPATVQTPGTCTLYNAAVDYLLTWNGTPGSSGQLPVHCTWVLGIQACSPGQITFPLDPPV